MSNRRYAVDRQPAVGGTIYGPDVDIIRDELVEGEF